MMSKMGKLYNRESILEYLVTKSDKNKIDDIKSLKDVMEPTLYNNPSYENPDNAEKKKKKHKDSTSSNKSQFPFACKITNLK